MAYVVSSLWAVDFWMVVSVVAIPVLTWHGFLKPHRDKALAQKEKDREQTQHQQQIRHRAIYSALDKVEQAYKAASTRTINGVLDPTFTGEHYDTLMYARNATTAVARFIDNPPAPLEETASRQHLYQWSAVLRNALREP